MKKLISLILCLVLLLALVACSEDPTDTTEPTVTEPDTPTETTPTEEPAPTETMPSVETTPTEEPDAPTEEHVPSEPTPEEELPPVYMEAVQALKDTLDPEEAGLPETLLFDIDYNGTEELILMFPATENGINIFASSVYTIDTTTGEPVLIPLLENHRVFYNTAGSIYGSVGVAQIDGATYFYVRNNAYDHMGYEDESLLEDIGNWKLYSLTEGSLVLETTFFFDLLHSNENIEAEGVFLRQKFEGPDYEAEILPELSTVTMNGEPSTVEVYSHWLDTLTILQDIDGYSDEVK